MPNIPTPDYCAIDFGTSNSAVALPTPDGVRLVALEAGHATMPTAVFYVADSPAHLAEPERLYGRAAVAAYVDFALQTPGIQRHRFLRELFALSRQVTPAVFAEALTRGGYPVTILQAPCNNMTNNTSYHRNRCCCCCCATPADYHCACCHASTDVHCTKPRRLSCSSRAAAATAGTATTAALHRGSGWLAGWLTMSSSCWLKSASTPSTRLCSSGTSRRHS